MGRGEPDETMRLLYIMDPVESILPDKDTTFAFLRGAQRRGHENFHAELAGVHVARGEVHARATGIFVVDSAPLLTLQDGVEDLPLREVGAVLIRRAPPFDQAYLHTTLLLGHAR